MKIHRTLFGKLLIIISTFLIFILCYLLYPDLSFHFNFKKIKHQLSGNFEPAHNLDSSIHVKDFKAYILHLKSISDRLDKLVGNLLSSQGEDRIISAIAILDIHFNNLCERGSLLGEIQKIKLPLEGEIQRADGFEKTVLVEVLNLKKMDVLDLDIKELEELSN